MFSRRWIINYILIFLIILFTYVGNRFGVQTGYQSNPPVSELRPADVKNIEIRTEGSSLSLSLRENRWTIDAPIDWPADQGNVERLLSIADSRTESRLGADEIDLATLGLDLPKAVLRLNDTQILFGDTNNIGERRYIKIGDSVYLLPDVHLPFVSQGALGLVSRRLLPSALGLARLELPGLAIERTQDGSWRSNPEAQFSAAQLKRLVDNWQDLSASRIQAFDGRNTPRQKIAAQLDNGPELEFFIMSIDPEIVIANPRIGLQYHFRADLYYQLIALKSDANDA